MCCELVKNNCPIRVTKCLRTWSRVRLMQGDRTLTGIARALNDDPTILRLLETYEHVNEFVCATFACDMNKMRNALAFGAGKYFHHNWIACYSRTNSGLSWQLNTLLCSLDSVARTWQLCIFTLLKDTVCALSGIVTIWDYHALMHFLLFIGLSRDSRCRIIVRKRVIKSNRTYNLIDVL